MLLVLGVSPMLGAASGQATPAQPSAGKPDPAKLAEESLHAFAKGDYAQAERLLREQLAIDGANFVPHYNLACILAMRGQREPAMAELVAAVERGFVDRLQLDKDPSLGPLRGMPEFGALLSNWPIVLERHRDATLERAKKTFSHRVTSIDEHRRLCFVSAFDDRSTAQAQDEIARVAEWGERTVFPGIFDADASKNDPWVVVILPSRKDFVTWLVATFGPGAINSMNSIGGSYDHDAKRLVSQDLGSSLRHEFFHVLHWRSMTRLGQVHPIWVQEGLCSLVEDYDVVRDDHGAETIRPAASWRTNISKRLARNSLLMPIEKLCGLSRAQFMEGRPLAMYAQSRTLFLYLYEKGKLGEWYGEFCRGFDKDPTGVEALKAVLALDLNAMNADYRAWVRAMPEVPEEIQTGKASLGIEVDAGGGEGPVVASVGARAVLPEGRGSLRVGDVLTAINGRPTREIAELVRVLGECAVGETVEVSYRRGQKYGTAKVTLVAK